ncbi:MAG TPA: formimidoylglutamate deiminase [Xanthomonadaceae bacterium]|nr:formimidoylglutamate deiminase [Xanthomonadaceae bacterium]
MPNAEVVPPRVEPTAALARLEPPGWRLPGIANLHSHAFQRAMAGLAERQVGAQDSFWSWRETMYRFAGRVDPDAQFAIARQLYVEMLEAGYTAVCEFHYLHHAPDGRPCAEPTAMADAIIAAAEGAGIRLTLLPVLYQRGGFDGRALAERQRRFAHSTDNFLRLHEALRRRRSPMLEVGVAFHSLRAVPLPAMREVLDALGDARGPVHIHIAEQQAEVDDCLAAHGRRPVRLLLDELPVDARWTLVHATHLDGDEIAGIARARAVVALCPSTEGNLGDGLFPLRAFLAVGGRFGIGSDSHVSVSPVEELRWLEYGQRLVEQRRARAALAAGSTGEALLAAVAESAADASGFDASDDALWLDAAHPLLAAARADDVVDRWIFSGNRPLLREVRVAGRAVVVEGRHPRRDEAARGYAAAIARLLAD